MTKLRAAVIGLGVGERHIEGYEADGHCKVVALCDADPAKLSEVSKRHPGRRITTDAYEVLDDRSIDVVSIATYDDVHYAQVVRALKADKHVFVEKPLCLHEHELDDIQETLKERPRLRLSSNLILRRSPRFAELRQQLRAGKLGSPYYCEADYNYGRLNKITDGWRGTRSYYSVVHGGGIHLIDLMMWILGERPIAVTAFGNAIATRDTQFKFNDCVVALLKFPSGVIAKLAANFGCVFPHHHNVTVYGTDATFVHDVQGARLYTTRDEAAQPTAMRAAYRGPAKGDMLPSFVTAIVNGGEPEVRADEVFDAMKVSIAVERAAATASTVQIAWK